MAHPLTSAQFRRLLDDRLTEAYQEEYEYLPFPKEQLFNVQDTDKAWEEYFSVGNIPDPELFNGTVIYQDVAPGYHTKIEPVEYAGGIIIERKLIDDERYDIIEGMAGGLGEAMKRKQTKIAHEPFIYATSAAFTFMTSEEGVALASDSHTTKATGVSTSTGFDNLATLPFDGANLEVLRLQGLRLRSDIGERFSTNFDTIIYPSSLSRMVDEVVGTQSGLDTEHGNINTQYKKWKTIELPLLDDYDTKSWGIVDSRRMKRFLYWLNRIGIEKHMTVDFDTFMTKYIDYARFAWGFTDWRWIIWSNVS